MDEEKKEGIKVERKRNEGKPELGETSSRRSDCTERPSWIAFT